MIKSADIDSGLNERFSICDDQFEQLVKVLIKFVRPIGSTLTNTKFKGFADFETGSYIYKEEMK